MIWTMPRPVLQWVAGLLAVSALGAFTMGIVNAPERGGRLPGERAAAQAGGQATIINAADATPLAQERIETAPPPVKPVNKTDSADDEDNSDDTAPAAPPAKALNATPPTPSTAPPADTSAPTAPPPEEPPH